MSRRGCAVPPDPVAQPRIAYAGVPGAFAELACRAFRPEHGPVGYHGFAEALAAVLAGAAECAAIPIENSAAGPVPGVAALLDRRDLRIAARRDLVIAMHCLGLPGASLEDIAEVHSHEVALRQCADFVSDRGWCQVEAANTAAAARDLAKSGAMDRAVLASERTAQLYGLVILAREVQDRADNRTVFAIVERS